MTTAVKERPQPPASSPRPTGGRSATGGAPARRAVVRWAWRMFRREWRRQVLVLALLAVAVGATTVGLALASNAAELHADPMFGTASTILHLPGSDPALASDLAAARREFGTIDVVAHQSIAIPGSVSTLDVRAENPDGPYVRPTVRLDSGRYPAGTGEVAVTRKAAAIFDLHVGGVWSEGGRTFHVVGLVENPLDLQEQFALVAPGQANPPGTVSVLANTSRHQLESFRFPSHAGTNIEARGTASKTAAETIVLVLGTVGLLFVALLAVAGFAVMAQRRMRATGLLASLGATDRHVRLVMLANGFVVGAVGALVGAAAGIGVWIASAPRFESIVDHRIDRFNLPWWAVGASIGLATLSAIAAAWWPARAAARIPIVAALSGRPPRPQPAHRFAAAGAVMLAVGLLLLAFAHQNKAPFIISGALTTVIGFLLLAPLAIAALAALGGRFPIAVRLAVRDLARYQARSGAALGAATLAVAIAATIAISAAAAQPPSPIGNLPPNQVNVYVGQRGFGPGSAVPVLTMEQQATVQADIDGIAATLHASAAVPLQAAFNPNFPPQAPGVGPGGGPGGQIVAALAHVKIQPRGEEVNPAAQLYVATPALLAHLGIAADQISPNTDIVTSLTGLGDVQIFLPDFGDGSAVAKPGPAGPGRPNTPAAAAHPAIQNIHQLPAFTSDPNTLITTHGLEALGLKALPAGWLIQTPSALSSLQIDQARRLAASAGLSIETKSAQKSLTPLRNWSTLAGILVALGVLAMTVGLIRSETGGDLRTLSATGASSTTRRTLTGATAGALALLAAVLGTAGAYAALLAWHRSDLQPLSHVPLTNLIIIVGVLPVVATAAGWLLAGREPSDIARQPMA